MHAASDPIPGGEGTTATAPESIARELGGDLPCAWCGYNLRGLSVRSVCPECGTAVRATILARVDPYAEVLRPITHPRLTATGMLLWAIGSLTAALLVWAMRIADGTVVFWSLNPRTLWMAHLGTACILAAAVGGLSLLRPHAGIAWRQTLLALSGIAAMLAAAALYHAIHTDFDPGRLKPYFTGDGMLTERICLRLGMGVAIIVALICLRPNARLLAARSLLLRMGRVDRQTMRAMALAVGIGMLGDLLHLFNQWMPGAIVRITESLGDFLIAVGAMFFTVGLVGVVLDTIRIAPVLLRPPLSIGRLLNKGSAPVVQLPPPANPGGAAAGSHS